jgi:hypothetical protein
VTGITGYFTPSSSQTAGAGVASQTDSLAAIGAGIVGMFVKLFLVSTVYLALAGVLFAALVLRRTSRDFPTGVAGYLVLGLVAIAPLPVVYFAASVSEQYFRHFGFIMFLATLLGAFALSEGDTWTTRSAVRGLRSLYRYGVPVVFAVMLVLSLAAVHPSPYVHKSNRHVTESEMVGFEMAMDGAIDSVPFTGVRGRMERYEDAIYGTEGRTQAVGSVSAENLTSLPATFDDRGYTIVSEYTRRREIGAYEELRFSRSDFESLSTQRGVDRVLANSEVALYYVG